MKLKSISFSPEENHVLELVVNHLLLNNIGFFPFPYLGEKDLNKNKLLFATNSHNSFVIRYYEVQEGLYGNIATIIKWCAIVNMPLEEFMPLYNKYKKLKAFS